jgi:hypothetical protein
METAVPAAPDIGVRAKLAVGIVNDATLVSLAMFVVTVTV